MVAFANAQEIAELLPYLTPEEQEQLDALMNPPKPRPVETFRAYVDRASSGKFKWTKHHERIARVCQSVADGELKRVMVFLPPRHGKSELISRYFSAYFLSRFPDQWVGLCSYGAELAEGLSHDARIRYLDADGPMDRSSFAKNEWRTGLGGGLFAAGVGGPIMGKGFHLGIIDDPHKDAEEAKSALKRNRIKEWYQGTWSTREEPGGAQIVVCHRWNQDDLPGWLLSQEGEDEDDLDESWHIVHFQAIKEDALPPYPDTCTIEPDWREPGEALWPERFPIDRLLRRKKIHSSYYWNALYQGYPRPREGGFFKRDWFEIVNAVPATAVRARGWDLAATEGGGDFTAGGKISKTPDGTFYVEDMVRGQWSTAKRDRMVLQTAETDGKRVRIRGPQDPGSAGKDAALAFVKLLAGFNVRTEVISGDKETRAGPFASQAEVGNVKLVNGPWVKAFLDELCDFPHGKYDDQVDAISTTFNELHVRVASTPAFVPQSESYVTV